MNILVLKNPKAMEVPAIKGLFDRGIAKSAWAGMDGAVDELRNLIQSPTAGVILGEENGCFRGFSLVLLPQSKLDTIPQVIHIYNEGTKSLRRKIVQATVDFIEKAGYNKLWAMDFTGRSRAWDRAMKPEGWSLKQIGRIVEIAK